MIYWALMVKASQHPTCGWCPNPGAWKDSPAMVCPCSRVRVCPKLKTEIPQNTEMLKLVDILPTEGWIRLQIQNLLISFCPHSWVLTPVANYRHISPKSAVEVKAKPGKSGILWEQMVLKSSDFSNISKLRAYLCTTHKSHLPSSVLGLL